MITSPWYSMTNLPSLIGWVAKSPKPLSFVFCTLDRISNSLATRLVQDALLLQFESSQIYPIARLWQPLPQPSFSLQMHIEFSSDGFGSCLRACLENWLHKIFSNGAGFASMLTRPRRGRPYRGLSNKCARRYDETAVLFLTGRPQIG